MKEENEMAMMARAVCEMSRTVSRQAGELQAMFIVLHGLLAFDGLPAATKDLLRVALERCAASNLHQPISEEFMTGFLGRVEVLKASLR
jgi:hypothetical protein